MWTSTHPNVFDEHKFKKKNVHIKIRFAQPCLINLYLANGKLVSDYFFFFKLGLTPCKAEQLLRGMELQEKKSTKKITGYRKSV